MREEFQIKRVRALIEDYNYSQPFSNYLKEYFRKHHEMGSNDRRITRDWSFNFFRIGKNLSDQSFEIRLGVANFICSEKINPSLSYLIKEHSGMEVGDIERKLEEKIQLVEEKYPSFSSKNIFQMHGHLSPVIDKEEWCHSFLKKPFVWIRIRRDNLDDVINELQENKITFNRDDDPGIVRFSSDVSLERLKTFQKGFFEIQDKSSQLTRKFFKPGKDEYWWDACAGSGGKSLLLKEEDPSVRIFATDSRPKILTAYSDRMKKAGHQSFSTKVMDLSIPEFDGMNRTFDGIIADVPCSGSGTWARSPEWLLKDQGIEVKEHFQKIQRKIISNIISYLRPGFPLIYITCSVFIEENEENIQFFLEHLPLKLEKSAFLEGYRSGGDTLFVSRMVRL